MHTQLQWASRVNNETLISYRYRIIGNCNTSKSTYNTRFMNSSSKSRTYSEGMRMWHSCKMTHLSAWSTTFPSLPGCDGNGYFHLYIFAIGIKAHIKYHNLNEVPLQYEDWECSKPLHHLWRVESYG